jgi:hypothetical protein
MNLSELIKQIPNFVHDVVTKQREDNEMVGQFHLGQQYEISTWINNKRCGVYPCELERENIYYEEDKETGARTLKKVRTVRVNIYLVVTETILLVLETDQTLKNVAKLTSWATLSALEKIRHKLEPDDYIQFFWRRLPGQKEPWVLNVQMHQNSNDCIECIKRNLTAASVKFSKNYEKKRKFKQNEVDHSVM